MKKLFYLFPLLPSVAFGQEFDAPGAGIGGFFIVTLWILGLFLAAFIFRFVFSIRAQMKFQATQIKLLILLLKIHGVAKEDINDALK